MYPIIRLMHQSRKYRNKSLPLDGEHVSMHHCLPVDLDVWMELNNGRTLTLYDLGRLPLVQRTGLLDVFKEQGWSFTVAGSSVRYRKRVTVFTKLEMHSKIVGRDARFLYIVQSMWHKGEATSSGLFRLAVTNGGIVPSDEWTKALGVPDWNPALPAWVQAWVDAEALRAWPPEDYTSVHSSVSPAA
ncbi:thioeseterase [Rhodobacterales bacterium 52_120_T64]|nr:thioeseterase [Rhodobacterales bacterium 52_120_T64]